MFIFTLIHLYLIIYLLLSIIAVESTDFYFYSVHPLKSLDFFFSQCKKKSQQLYWTQKTKENKTKVSFLFHLQPKWLVNIVKYKEISDLLTCKDVFQQKPETEHTQLMESQSLGRLLAALSVLLPFSLGAVRFPGNILTNSCGLTAICIFLVKIINFSFFLSWFSESSHKTKRVLVLSSAWTPLHSHPGRLVLPQVILLSGISKVFGEFGLCFSVLS